MNSQSIDKADELVTKLESMIENVQTELEEAIVLLRQIVGDTSGDTK